MLAAPPPIAAMPAGEPRRLTVRATRQGVAAQLESAGRAALEVGPSSACQGRRVVVVGAGIAGLSAAYLCRKAGFDVRVLEGDHHVGGRMSTYEHAGLVVDSASQMFSDQSRALMPLIETLGLRQELTAIPRGGLMVRDAMLHRLDVLDPRSVLRAAFATGLFRIPELGRMLFGGFELLSRDFDRSMLDYAAWQDLDNETAAEWATRLFGKAFCEYVAEPMLAGPTFLEPENVSCVPLIWLLLFFQRARELLTFTKGMQTLPDALARSVEVTTGTPVHGVETSSERVRVHARGGTEDADWVILATPAPIAARLYRDHGASERELLATTYDSVINVNVEASRDWRGLATHRDVYSIGIPRKERRMLTALNFDYRRQVRGREMIQMFAQPTSSRELWSASDEVIARAAIDEASAYVPGLSTNAVSHTVQRIEYAVPAQPIGKAKSVADYRGWFAASDTRVALAGDYLGFFGTDGAASTGLSAARAIIAKQQEK